MKASTIGFLLAPVLLIFFYLSVLHQPATPSVEFVGELNNNQDLRKLPELPPIDQPSRLYTPTNRNHRVDTSAKNASISGNDSLEALLSIMSFDESHMEERVWRPYTEFHHKMLTLVPSNKQRFAVYQCHGGCGGMGVRFI